MPHYDFLMNNSVDLRNIAKQLQTLRNVGVPYGKEMVENAYNDAMAQAHPGTEMDGLNARYGKKVVQRDFDGQPDFTSEMDALVAYLQTLGTLADLKNYKLEETKP